MRVSLWRMRQFSRSRQQVGHFKAVNRAGSFHSPPPARGPRRAQRQQSGRHHGSARNAGAVHSWCKCRIAAGTPRRVHWVWRSPAIPPRSVAKIRQDICAGQVVLEPKHARCVDRVLSVQVCRPADAAMSGEPSDAAVAADVPAHQQRHDRQRHHNAFGNSAASRGGHCGTVSDPRALILHVAYFNVCWRRRRTPAAATGSLRRCRPV